MAETTSSSQLRQAAEAFIAGRQEFVRSILIARSEGMGYADIAATTVLTEAQIKALVRQGG